jgi:hypothetical protein
MTEFDGARPAVRAARRVFTWIACGALLAAMPGCWFELEPGPADAGPADGGTGPDAPEVSVTLEGIEDGATVAAAVPATVRFESTAEVFRVAVEANGRSVATRDVGPAGAGEVDFEALDLSPWLNGEVPVQLTAVAEAGDPEAPGVGRSAPVRVRVDDRDPLVEELRTPDEDAFALQRTGPHRLTVRTALPLGDGAPVALGRSFVERYGSLWGLEQPAEELVLDDVQVRDPITTVRFVQRAGEVPVYGGVMTLQMVADGPGAMRMVRASGNVLREVPALREGVLSADEARQGLARQLPGLEGGPPSCERGRPRLTYVDEGLFQRPESVRGYAWQLTATVEGMPTRIFANAYSGEVMRTEPLVRADKSIDVRDHQGVPFGTSIGTCGGGVTCPGSQVCVNGLCRAPCTPSATTCGTNLSCQSVGGVNVCAECAVDSDCSGRRVCRSGLCTCRGRCSDMGSGADATNWADCGTGIAACSRATSCSATSGQAGAAFDQADYVYDFYDDNFNWWGMYGEEEVDVNVDVWPGDNGGGSAQHQWNCGTIIFDRGAVVLDVVAHEYSHGVLDAQVRYPYRDQQGALDEHVGDATGVLVQALRTGTLSWQLGDQGGGASTRNLANPPDRNSDGIVEDGVGSNPSGGDADHLDVVTTNPGWWPSATALPANCVNNRHNPTQPDCFFFTPDPADNRINDSGGVHYFSGIPNKAIALMGSGGRHRGVTVEPLDDCASCACGRICKLAALIYNTAAIFLDSSSGLADYANELIAQAQRFVDFRGVYEDAGQAAPEITPHDLCQIRNAFYAVGLVRVAQADLDCDGEPDGGGADTDGDGVANGLDNCPEDDNPTQSNVDGDPTGDACDDDIDGDGVPNDGDGDGLVGVTPCSGAGGSCDDNCLDVANPMQTDTNGDGIGDACQQEDADDDGTDDWRDNCVGASNPSQADLDGDGRGDACDDDVDGDGVDDASDNCRRVPNADQANANPDVDEELGIADGERGDACGDADGDGIPYDADPCNLESGEDVGGLCESTYDCAAGWTCLGNTCVRHTRDGYDPVTGCRSPRPGGAVDFDGDGMVDTCRDLDDDGDGVEDPEDACPFASVEGADLDLDGIPDACDACPSTPPPEGQPGHLDADCDGDGDVCDTDDDNDGVADSSDNCSHTVNPDQADVDGDGIGDACSLTDELCELRCPQAEPEREVVVDLDRNAPCAGRNTFPIPSCGFDGSPCPDWLPADREIAVTLSGEVPFNFRVVDDEGRFVARSTTTGVREDGGAYVNQLTFRPRAGAFYRTPSGDAVHTTRYRVVLEPLFFAEGGGESGFELRVEPGP